jgi:hypothetical protein
MRSGREISSPTAFPGNPAVPALRELAERQRHLVGQVEVLGEEPPAVAEVRRHQLEALLASGQHLSKQTAAFGQRPVVRQPADEVPQILGRLRNRAEDLHAALEVDLVASHPARQVGRRGGTAHVDEKGDVVDVGALLRGAAEPISQLECRQADPKLVLERLAQAEVGGQ